MSAQGTTVDPISGKVYRIVAPKARSAAFVALEAAVRAAKEAQASYMRENSLAFDGTRVITVDTTTGEAPTDGAISAEMARLLVATKAAQTAVKQYKITHPNEFQAQAQGPRAGRIPVVNPRGGFRGRGRGR